MDSNAIVSIYAVDIAMGQKPYYEIVAMSCLKTY